VVIGRNCVDNAFKTRTGGFQTRRVMNMSGRDRGGASGGGSRSGRGVEGRKKHRW